MTAFDKSLHACRAKFRPSPRNGSDAGMLEPPGAHRCPRFSLNSAEEPPRSAFSRQSRHDSLHGKPNTGFPAGSLRIPPTGFEPVISCVKAPSIRRSVRIGSRPIRCLGPSGAHVQGGRGAIGGAIGFHAPDGAMAGALLPARPPWHARSRRRLAAPSRWRRSLPRR
jgi:hypothetical protein